jgi:transcription elongation factor Elf1
VKVLRKPDTNWTKTVTCRGCEATLEIEIGDFKKYIDDQRDGAAAAFVCPCCHAEQWVATSLIPSHLHRFLPR